MGKHCRKGEEETKEKDDQENENSSGPSRDEGKVSLPENGRRCGMGGGRRWRGPMGGAGQCPGREGPHGGPQWVGIMGQSGPGVRGPCPGRRGPLGGLGQCPAKAGKCEGRYQQPRGDGCQGGPGRWLGPQGPWRRWAANQGEAASDEAHAPTDQDVQGEEAQQARKYMRQCWRQYWRHMNGDPAGCKGKKGKMGKQGKTDEENTEKDGQEATSGSSSDDIEVSPSEKGQGRCGMRGGRGWWRVMGPAGPLGVAPFPGRRGLFGGQGQCPGRAGPCPQTLGPHGLWRHWAATQGKPESDEGQAPTDQDVQGEDIQQARKYMRQCWRQYWRQMNGEQGQKGKMGKHGENDEENTVEKDGKEAATEGAQAKNEAPVEQDVNIELPDPSTEPAPYKEKTGAEEPTETENTNKESDQSATENADREWTFVGRADPSANAPADPSAQTPTRGTSVKTPEESAKPKTDTPSLYPKISDASSEKHIGDAIAHMKAMGFDDEGGWLTSLVTAKDGNITSALDAIQIGHKK